MYAIIIMANGKCNGKCLPLFSNYHFFGGINRKLLIFEIVSARRLSKFELVFELLPIEITDSYTLSKLSILGNSLGY